MDSNEIFENRKAIILEFMESEFYIPMREKELMSVLLVQREDKKEFRDVLRALRTEGLVVMSKRGKLRIAPPKITGVFEAHSGGFGFLISKDCDRDLFIKNEDALGAMNGDKVEVQTYSFRGRTFGKIVNIISRATTQVVGTYDSGGKNGNYGFVIPDDSRITHDIFIPPDSTMDAIDGMKVVAKILKYGDNRHKSIGEISEIIGMKDEPGVDIESVVRAYGLPEYFPYEAEEQAKKAAKPVSPEDISKRRDLRDVLTVTIDGEDAKDLDDAVSLSIDEDGCFRLGVHIADVSHYVQENTALDREALERGTSVYLADRVIPMLPVELSNGCCSLNPREDRLTLSCLMKIDSKGKLLESEICESVINSDRRMSYNEVFKLLTGDAPDELKRECDYLMPMFKDMERLSSILIKIREKRGAIDFDFPETKVILDENGHTVALEPRLTNTATKIIESFMLEANETVAEYCCFQELPFVFRSHDKPDPEKIKILHNYVLNLGFSLKVSRDGVHPKELQKLLNIAKDTPEEALIARMTLRSMSQAKYTTEPIGHFGLACQYYCHFTSPIRRYPDLQIHRIIKEQLSGRMNGVRLSHYDARLDRVALQSSERERRAEDAEREVEKLKKAEYMLDHIGDEYDGVISGVSAHVLYVELPNTVEGMVRLSELDDDFYVYNDILMEVKGRKHGRTYRLGDAVKVEVLSADKELKIIDFSIVRKSKGAASERHGAEKKRRKKAHSK